MKVINLSYPHQLKRDDLPETVAAIGFFDGIHLGHQAVIKKAVKLAKETDKESAVISFHPHPSVVLNTNNEKVRYITTLTEKEQLLRDLGVDRFYIITFNLELSKLLPKQFIDHFVIGLHINHLVAGFDFTFGHKGSGTMEMVQSLSDGEVKTTIVDKQSHENEKVSSTRIRKTLSEGNVHDIKALLGRHYDVSGIVIHGDRRGGKQLGFPTANLEIDPDKLLPKQGVYAVKVHYNGDIYNGMANLGFVPTFKNDQSELKLEVYIFDFDKNIYDEVLVVEFHRYIRAEKKFNGIDEIIKQLQLDENEIRAYFT